jgi:23S rRNA (adenine-N6)-dimethyltransferase
VAGRPLAPNPAGAHFLHDHRLVGQLARASGAGDGRLVFDLGAGGGAITAELATTGARVIAVERDPRFAARLRGRFSTEPLVRVVEADLRTVPLPRREFLVVASPPFSLTTTMCRRLLGDPAVRLAGAELIVQWGAARRLVSDRPRDAETAWWTARYQMRLTRVISPASFVPAPRVHAAWLTVRPYPVHISSREERWLRSMLQVAYRRPGTRTDLVLPVPRRVLHRAGVDPAAPVGAITAYQWHRLAVLVGGGSLGSR